MEINGRNILFINILSLRVKCVFSNVINKKKKNNGVKLSEQNNIFKNTNHARFFHSLKIKHNLLYKIRRQKRNMNTKKKKKIETFLNSDYSSFSFSS